MSIDLFTNPIYTVINTWPASSIASNSAYDRCFIWDTSFIRIELLRARDLRLEFDPKAVWNSESFLTVFFQLAFFQLLECVNKCDAAFISRVCWYAWRTNAAI